MTDYQAIVVGGGPAGLVASCLLAKEGLTTALIASPRPPDRRTVALMQPALQLLAYLGVWPGELKPVSAALRKQRIVDDTGALMAAPELLFSADELHLAEFGWNIPLRALVDELHKLALHNGVKITETEATGSETLDDRIGVDLLDGSRITARVVLAADGHNSQLRSHAGITAETWRYEQSAIISRFRHSVPHEDTSTEFHKRHGPCTVVPLPGLESAVVWMTSPALAEQLGQLPDAEFAAELQAAIHGRLGLVTHPAPRQVFPMRGLTAARFSAGRTILIGEAAHVVPPIGAQGLNMSFRDAALACDLMVGESDPGRASIISTYHERRKPEVAIRQSLIAAMNRSLLLDMLPVDSARAAALWAVHGLMPSAERSDAARAWSCRPPALCHAPAARASSKRHRFRLPLRLTTSLAIIAA